MTDDTTRVFEFIDRERDGHPEWPERELGYQDALKEG